MSHSLLLSDLFTKWSETDELRGKKKMPSLESSIMSVLGKTAHSFIGFNTWVSVYGWIPVFTVQNGADKCWKEMEHKTLEGHMLCSAPVV